MSVPHGVFSSSSGTPVALARPPLAVEAHCPAQGLALDVFVSPVLEPLHGTKVYPSGSDVTMGLVSRDVTLGIGLTAGSLAIDWFNSRIFGH